MERFVKGDVVIVPFPFSDLSKAKRRPALVVTAFEGDDLLLCQITSQAVRDDNAVPLAESDFASGGLPRPSHARPNRLFTADHRLILYRAGHLAPQKVEAVIAAIERLLRR